MQCRLALQQMRPNLPALADFPPHFIVGLGKFCRASRNPLDEFTGRRFWVALLAGIVTAPPDSGSLSRKERVVTRTCLGEPSDNWSCSSLISCPKGLGMRESRLPTVHILTVTPWEVLQKTLKKDEKL
jgi:hypothetical protein